MRKSFQPQLTLGCTPIEQVEAPVKTKSHLAALAAALQYIYVQPEWNQRIFELLSSKLIEGKKKTGREGMSLWEVFVLAQVRLCMNISYDELHHISNYDTLVRGIMGVLPTDYNLLWDSARKCIDVADLLVSKRYFTGWRKSGDWRRSLKRLMRSVGRTTGSGGKNKEERVEQAATSYLTKARALSKKVGQMLEKYQGNSIEEFAALMALTYYLEMLEKHIELLDRRLIRAETIPHAEKVFSIFQPYAEMIKKGKLHPNVEIGKNLAITSDQYHLLIDWQIAEKQTDNQLTLSIARRIAEKYPIQSLSTDKGLSDKEDKATLQTFIPEVIMPKKGRLTRIIHRPPILGLIMGC